MASFAPAVAAGTAILPLLNGMRHVDVLADRFGRGQVLGGLCLISATLDAAGAVQHLNDLRTLRRLLLAERAPAPRRSVSASV